MKIGFAGTQKGMTEAQKIAFGKVVADMNCKELHHGDRIGAHFDAHQIASPTAKVVIHPPVNDNLRARCERTDNVTFRSRYSYVMSDQHIVKETDVLVACPAEFAEKQFSDTWATVRYARMQQKHVITIYPNGELA